VTGHRDPVLDVAWNPFNENEVASASEDCTIKLWDIADGGLTEDMKDPSLTLEGHQKKVKHEQQQHSSGTVFSETSSYWCSLLFCRLGIFAGTHPLPMSLRLLLLTTQFVFGTPRQAEFCQQLERFQT
jgi:hypothetical protein